MPYRAMLVALAVTGVALLSACESEVSFHEPGVYKGKHDETATQEAAERRQDQLRERAQTGMTDR